MTDLDKVLHDIQSLRILIVAEGYSAYMIAHPPKKFFPEDWQNQGLPSRDGLSPAYAPRVSHEGVNTSTISKEWFSFHGAI